jgi:hypothetical protein
MADTAPSDLFTVLAHAGADTLGPLLVAAAFILIGLVGLVARNLQRRERPPR